ncbi:hypothetical protein KIPB_011529, partial [Kipferlia bialata]|eukprot:g11529.t1
MSTQLETGAFGLRLSPELRKALSCVTNSSTNVYDESYRYTSSIKMLVAPFTSASVGVLPLGVLERIVQSRIAPEAFPSADYWTSRCESVSWESHRAEQALLTGDAEDDK